MFLSIFDIRNPFSLNAQMGNTYCFNENQKVLNVEKHTESIILTPTSSSQNILPQPTRTRPVEQIYQNLVQKKPLSYSIERSKHKFQTYSISIFGEEGMFVGEMIDNKPHGPGQIYFFNNNYLEAHFNNGQIDTHDAIMIENNGNYYRGGFKESVQTGSGILRTSGSEWKGKFEAGRIVGVGELKTPDGKVYKGTFQNGKMEGKGHLLDQHGNTYEGYFKQGKRQGIGHYLTKHYQYYGPFDNDMKQGKGTLILPNDEKFQGWFQKDKVHGYGEWHRKGGQIIKHNYIFQELSYFYQ